jgi:hypothetical protein
MWNGSLDSLTVSYLSLGIALYAKADEWRRQREEGLEPTGIPQFAGLSSFLFFGPVGAAVFLCRRDAEELYKQKMVDKFGTMYAGLHLIRHPYAKYYYPVFLLKRLLFVLIVIVMPDLGCH